MEPQAPVNNTVTVSKEVLWYLDNYILLKDYLDRTISRIAARCIRMGNIAMEEYPFYSYILDVLEEISDTGDFILAHKELYPLVEKKIQGGMTAFKKNLNDYKEELKNNATPDMVKQDASQELNKMKEALGSISKADDPTAGAGMSMDQVIEKLMGGQKLQNEEPDVPEILSPAELEKKQAMEREQEKMKALQAEALARKQAAAQVEIEASVPTQAEPSVQAAAPAPVQLQQPQAPAQPKPVVQQPQPTASAAAGHPHTVIKKVVKIVRPANPENKQAVPHKVPEE